MPFTNTFSGARAIFKINSTPVAYAGGVDVREEIRYEPVDVLNRLEVAEYVPVGYVCSLDSMIFRTLEGGNEVGTGSLKKRGIFPQEANILTDGSLEASITDQLTGRTVALVQEVKAASQNFGVTARGIVGVRVAFVAIRVKDEAEV